MFNPQNLDQFSISELEQMSWYGLVSKIGLQSFNINGTKPIEHIAQYVSLNEKKKVLMVGCGSGGTSNFLAQISGASVYGIDIDEISINEAKALAAQSSAKDLLHFQVADVNKIPFEDNFFDVVITEFMAFFLNQSAFNEMYRVIKPNGKVALAELMKLPEVTPFADRKILEIEKIHSEITGFTFHIPLTTDYISLLSHAGFTNIIIKEKFGRAKTQELIQAVGGWKNLWIIMKWMIKIMWKSPKIRQLFMKQGKVKRVIMRDPRTAKFVIQVIMLGEKLNGT